MENEKLSLLNVTYGIFFNNPLKRPDLVAEVISKDEEYGKIFNETPIILPVPIDVIDIPVVQLLSEKRNWKLDVTRKRINILFDPEKNKKYSDIEKEIGDIKEMIKKIVDKAKEEEGVFVERVTNISNFIYDTENPNPNEFIRKTFFGEKKQSAKQLFIRYNEPNESVEIPYNSITSFQAVLKNDENKEYVLIQKDFNSMPEKKKKFDKDEIEKFLKIAEDNSHSINNLM